MKMMELMVKVQVWDSMLQSIQRQGRISFYMTCAGEEASLVGSAAALGKEDIVLPQYRELPVLMWRGLSPDKILAQLFATQTDPGKGHQMPVHYASDAAVGLNFAAALQTQTLFICRNNGYAISTPATEQYKGDGIAARAVAYGIDALRVDGTDLVAVYRGIKAARRRALRCKRPVLVEMMTYRLGHHSTSDDSTTYRTREEVDQWNSPGLHPINRFGKYLEYHVVRDEPSVHTNAGPLESRHGRRLQKRRGPRASSKTVATSAIDNRVLSVTQRPLERSACTLRQKPASGHHRCSQRCKGKQCFSQCVKHRSYRQVEKEKHPPVISGLFDDVYNELPSSLKEQRDSLLAFLSQKDNSKRYPLQRFATKKYGDEHEDVTGR